MLAPWTHEAVNMRQRYQRLYGAECDMYTRPLSYGDGPTAAGSVCAAKKRRNKMDAVLVKMQ